MGFVLVLLPVVAILCLKVQRLLSPPDELKHLPAISLWQCLISLLRAEPYDVLFERIKRPVLERAGVARLWIQGKWGIVISDAKDVKEVLLKPDMFLKRRKEDPNTKVMLLRRTLGFTNIAISDGEDWRCHRRVASPAFKKALSPLAFTGCTNKLVSLIKGSGGVPQDIHDLFRRLTLDILGRGLFSYDFKAIEKGRNSQDMQLYNDVMEAVFDPFYLLFPRFEGLLPSRRESFAKSSQFRELLLGIIRKRKLELTTEHNDLLSSIIRASLEEGTFSEDDVINDLGVFFVAGHDTTANTLTTTFFYLSKHQDIQEKARDEALQVLKGKHHSPTCDELKAMPYIDCIIKESMRIVATSFQLLRYSPNRQVLSSGVVIPKDTFISLNTWMAHHDPDMFPEPYKFRPERFADPSGKQDSHWIPFGFGARMCIGKAFSLMEQRVVISTLLRNFVLKPGPASQKQTFPKLNSSGLIHPVGADVIFVPIRD
ncbi:hypothetical protein DSO57_1010116 [Entomophthora muscae]|uniref:Uncharacterized protein n=1 Tax=Entomophthora muscae TaxID=34485 RepID=A0ACC2SVT4_9FUNG|nr:hypothetical protein DSO57_1010116 [Entomophthora muscae]